jgi:hypothetical protein
LSLPGLAKVTEGRFVMVNQQYIFHWGYLHR